MYNIKIDLTEIGWGGTNWTNLAHDKGQWRPQPLGYIKFWEVLE
jgi:hypothetical protein